MSRYANHYRFSLVPFLVSRSSAVSIRQVKMLPEWVLLWKRNKIEDWHSGKFKKQPCWLQKSRLWSNMPLSVPPRINNLHWGPLESNKRKFIGFFFNFYSSICSTLKRANFDLERAHAQGATVLLRWYKHSATHPQTQQAHMLKSWVEKCERKQTGFQSGVVWREAAGLTNKEGLVCSMQQHSS